MKHLTIEQANLMMQQNDGSLYLDGCTSITSLPENLTVGGSLDLDGCTSIQTPTYYKTLSNGDYVPKCYLYADNILTHIKNSKTVGDYTLYIGKIPGKNVVSDGKYYAHCNNLRDGIADIAFKRAKDRGADEYKNLTLDSVIKLEDAIVMYRIITGACQQGTQQFVNNQKELKEEYNIREIIEATKGQYGAELFAEFFNN